MPFCREVVKGNRRALLGFFQAILPCFFSGSPFLCATHTPVPPVDTGQ